MIQGIDLSSGRVARRGMALLVVAILSIGLGAAPAQAGPRGGYGKYRAWRQSGSSTRVVYVAPAFSRPFIARTAVVVPRRTVRVYRAPTFYVSRGYVARTSPVYVTRRAYPVYRTTRFYRTAPLYYGTSRYYGYPSHYASPVYRQRRSVARDVLTVAATTGVGAVVGGLLGGRKGAVIGAITGGVGGVVVTQARGDRYRY